jgi:hypothetical protein
MYLFENYIINSLSKQNIYEIIDYGAYCGNQYNPKSLHLQLGVLSRPPVGAKISYLHESCAVAI